MDTKDRGGFLILIANLMVLGIVVKLYTEIVKAKTSNERARSPIAKGTSYPVHEGRPRH